MPLWIHIASHWLECPMQTHLLKPPPPMCCFKVQPSTRGYARPVEDFGPDCDMAEGIANVSGRRCQVNKANAFGPSEAVLAHRRTEAATRLGRASFRNFHTRHASVEYSSLLYCTSSTREESQAWSRREPHVTWHSTAQPFRPISSNPTA